MKVSVVIPTRNRQGSLSRTLAALARQTTPVDEILIIDASDTLCDVSSIAIPAAVRVEHIASSASVCKQRNTGIAAARGDYVFLCDDDIEPPADYVETLSGYIASTNAVAATGLCLQENAAGDWAYEYPITSLRRLLWTYFFQLGVWGSIAGSAESRPLLGWVHRRIAADYRAKGNDLSRAGWPILTQFGSDIIRTRVYALGATLIDRQVLLSNPFDEVLDPHGLGDNYGIAVTLPEKLHVLKATSFRHHLAVENRLAPELAFYRRILALHYFLTLYSTRTARLFLLWSLVGLSLASLFRSRTRLHATLKAIGLIVTGRNPYVRARLEGRKSVAPSL